MVFHYLYSSLIFLTKMLSTSCFTKYLTSQLFCFNEKCLKNKTIKTFSAHQYFSLVYHSSNFEVSKCYSNGCYVILLGSR